MVDQLNKVWQKLCENRHSPLQVIAQFNKGFHILFENPHRMACPLGVPSFRPVSIEPFFLMYVTRETDVRKKNWLKF